MIKKSRPRCAQAAVGGARRKRENEGIGIETVGVGLARLQLAGDFVIQMLFTTVAVQPPT